MVPRLGTLWCELKSEWVWRELWVEKFEGGVAHLVSRPQTSIPWGELWVLGNRFWKEGRFWLSHKEWGGDRQHPKGRARFPPFPYLTPQVCLFVCFSNQCFSVSTSPSNSPHHPEKNSFISVVSTILNATSQWQPQFVTQLRGEDRILIPYLTPRIGELIGVLWLWVDFSVHSLKYVEPTDRIFLSSSLVNALY